MQPDLIRSSMTQAMATAFDFYERRPGKYQLILPICHEDGDMVDVYLMESPRGDGYVRICDFGLALMRLSYTFEVNTARRERILHEILINNGVRYDDGNLFIDAPMGSVFENIMQFIGCVQKVCNMTYWPEEV